MAKFEIRSCYSSDQRDTLKLELAGRLDEQAAGRFQRFQHFFQAHEPSRVVLTFGVGFDLAPFGLAFLLGWIANLSSPIRQVFLVGAPVSLERAAAALAPPMPHVYFHPSGAPGDTFTAGLQSCTPPDAFVLTPAVGEAVAGVPFSMRVEARDAEGRVFAEYQGVPHLRADRGLVAPTMLHGLAHGVWEGDVLLTGPGRVTLRAWDHESAGEAAVEVVEHGPLATFPLDTACPGCRRAAVVGKSDYVRCLKCNQIYFVDPRGHVIPLKSGRERLDGGGKDIEFRIPSDINYLNHVRNFISGVCREEAVPEDKVSQIEMAMDEAMANVVKHAYFFDSQRDIQVNVGVQPGRLVIVIKDHGRSFDNDALPLPNIREHIERRRVGGLGRYLMKNLMDEVVYKSDATTNELRMVKKF